MYYTFEQLKGLVIDGPKTYKVVDMNISKERKKELLEMDEACVELYGFHLITNYQDLKNT